MSDLCQAYVSAVQQVSLLTQQNGSVGKRAQELFVYDIQTGVTSTCTFSANNSLLGQPQHHVWDSEHPLLLACEMSGSHSQPDMLPVLTVVTMFATPQGVVLQDSQLLQECQVNLRSHPSTHSQPFDL